MSEQDKHKDVVAKFRKQLNVLLGHSNWDLVCVSDKVSYSEKLPIGKWELVVEPVSPQRRRIVASFQLHPMINCCGICVSTQAMVQADFRNRGIGTLLNSFRIDVARHNGYGLLLCTDVMGNEHQRKVLRANGWKDVHEFVNPRTSNRVAISVINL